ncbi:Uncharacterised protein [Cedecea neteri]|uniref:Uncharacterized protein n=1 Tax=Cedecea neteri TaxID=158822 RepID=A0A2X3J4V0_9ENTR|nr:Uncharacterised protein [Cedecea neteri]
MGFKRGRRFIKNHQLSRAVDQRSGNLHQLAFGQAQLPDQAIGVEIQLPGTQEKVFCGLPHTAAVQQPTGTAIFLPQKHRLGHGKVWDQIEFLVNNAYALGLNGRGLTKRKRDAVERGRAAIGLINPGKNFN